MTEQYFTQDVYVGIANDYDKNITCYPKGWGMFKGKPGHTSFYAGFVKTPLGLKRLSSEKIYPVFEGPVHIRKDYAYEVEPIIFYMKSDEIPTTMTKEEIESFVAHIYSNEKREIFYQKRK